MSYRRYLNEIWQLLYPQRECPACGAAVSRPGLCPACRHRSQSLHRCALCGTFGESTADICPECREFRPLFAAAYAALPYEGRLRELLLDFKYNNQTYHRRTLAALLLAAWQDWQPSYRIDAIVPVPSSAARLEERGYEHTQLMAELLAEELGVPLEGGWLFRIKDTPPLHDLPRQQRFAQMRGSMGASPQVRGKRILIVDDICTTGATALACSSALLEQGAEAPLLLTCAAGATW